MHVVSYGILDCRNHSMYNEGPPSPAFGRLCGKVGLFMGILHFLVRVAQWNPEKICTWYSFCFQSSELQFDSTDHTTV